MRKIIQRSCIGCNIKKDKTELIRIVKPRNGVIVIDETGKLQGRGAYICGNIECLEKIIKTKRLERTFETNLPEEFYERLRGVAIEHRN